MSRARVSRTVLNFTLMRSKFWLKIDCYLKCAFNISIQIYVVLILNCGLLRSVALLLELKSTGDTLGSLLCIYLKCMHKVQ